MAKPRKWEMRMNEARELRKKGSEVLFDRVTILVGIYNDQSFRDWCEENETNDVEYLDTELDDTACDFITLKAVLEAYPDKESWIKHNIRVLIAEIIANQKSDDKPKERRPSWKDRCVASEMECERLRGEVNRLGARVNELQRALAIVSGNDAKLEAVG